MPPEGAGQLGEVERLVVQRYEGKPLHADRAERVVVNQAGPPCHPQGASAEQRDDSWSRLLFDKPARADGGGVGRGGAKTACHQDVGHALRVVESELVPDALYREHVPWRERSGHLRRAESLCYPICGHRHNDNFSGGRPPRCGSAQSRCTAIAPIASPPIGQLWVSARRTMLAPGPAARYITSAHVAPSFTFATSGTGRGSSPE